MIQPVGRYWVWRELFSKPIWLNSTVEQQVILMTLIAMANFQPNDWEWEGQKFKVDAGQFVTSINSIIENTGDTVSIQNIRSALKRFENLEFLTVKVTKTGSLITLVNWQSYQPKVNDLTQKPTQSQHRGNTEVTTIEEGKKEKKVKEEKDTTTENINEVVNLYKEKLQLLPQPSKITDARKKAINARIKDYSLEEVKEVINLISQSDYLLGRINDFKATIDWIFNPSNFAKIKEGNYVNRQTGVKTSGTVSDYIKNSGSQKFYNPKEV